MIPWGREREPTPVVWPGEFHGLYSPWDCKELVMTEWLSLSLSQMTLVVKNSPASVGDIRDAGLIPGSGRSPGGGRGNHSKILDWRIPWTEEPGRLHSIGLHRVGQDWSNLACMHNISAAAAAAKSSQSCLTLCDPIDGSPPGSPIPGLSNLRAHLSFPRLLFPLEEQIKERKFLESKFYHSLMMWSWDKLSQPLSTWDSSSVKGDINGIHLIDLCWRWNEIR